jgi:hypothetical protein
MYKSPARIHSSVILFVSDSPQYPKTMNHLPKITLYLLALRVIARTDIYDKIIDIKKKY